MLCICQAFSISKKMFIHCPIFRELRSESLVHSFFPDLFRYLSCHDLCASSTIYFVLLFALAHEAKHPPIKESNSYWMILFGTISKFCHIVYFVLKNVHTLIYTHFESQLILLQCILQLLSDHPAPATQ